jgi:hypothetical protein
MRANMKMHIIVNNDSCHSSCRPLMDYHISNYIMKSDSEQVTIDSGLTGKLSDQNISRTFQ